MKGGAPDGEVKLFRTSTWNLATAVACLIVGLPLLVLPNLVIVFLGFLPTDDAWVRICGMFFLMFSYSNYYIYQHKEPSWVVRMSIINRLWMALVFLTLGIAGYSILFYVLSALVWISVVGGWINYHREVR